MFPMKFLRMALAIALLLPAASGWADDGATESNLKVSGFLSVVGGNVIGGKLDGNYSGTPQINGANCPCYTADWSNGGVYDNNFSLKPESHAGIQATYSFNQTVNFTGQVVTRATDATPNVQWAYLGVKLSDDWDLHLGRQRIPLYYYSPFQDIGTAYPWVSPPPELYGWEATNYNGASLRYRTSVGDNNIAASVFAGQERVSDSLYYRLYYNSDTVVTWKSLVGADVEVNNGPLTVRAVYLQAKARDVNDAYAIDSTANLKAYGVAANLDMDKWFVLTEFTRLSRDYGNYTETSPAFTVGAGVRLGKWTPFLNFASYIDQTSNIDLYAPQSYRRSSFTLRYDVDASSDVKAQVDHNVDATDNYGGTVNVFRISYDRVF